MQAFALARLEGVRLVFTGEASKRFLELAQAHGVAEKITFLGLVPDSKLPALYRGALAFVFPSLYEGFGLPPLEAMACGTPVVASDRTAIPEVVGDAALLVDPYDPEMLAQALRRVVEDEVLRSELKTRGLIRAKLFSWDKVVLKVQTVLMEAMEEK